MAICTGPPDTIAAGSSGVMINGKPAARMTDSTAHGGKIIIGCSTVLIGGGGGGGGSTGSAGGEANTKAQPGTGASDVPEQSNKSNEQAITMENAALGKKQFCEICAQLSGG